MLALIRYIRMAQRRSCAHR